MTRLVLLFLLLTGWLAAQEILQTRPAPNGVFPSVAGPATSSGWPGRTTLRLRVEPYRSTWDGMPVAYQRFTSGSLSFVIRQQALGDWRVPAESPYAYAGTYWWHDDVRLYFAVFDRANGFLPSLQENAWLAYLTAVGRPQGRIRPVLRVNDLAGLQLLDGLTRVLAYDVPAPKPEERARSVAQVYVEFPEHLLVIGLEGPADQVLGAIPAFNQLLLGLENYPPPT